MEPENAGQRLVVSSGLKERRGTRIDAHVRIGVSPADHQLCLDRPDNYSISSTSTLFLPRQRALVSSEQKIALIQWTVIRLHPRHNGKQRAEHPRK